MALLVLSAKGEFGILKIIKNIKSNCIQKKTKSVNINYLSYLSVFNFKTGYFEMTVNYLVIQLTVSYLYSNQGPQLSKQKFFKRNQDLHYLLKDTGILKIWKGSINCSQVILQN